MCGFSGRASDLAASGYVFVTEGSKSFLVYSTGKRKGEPYRDPRTGKTFNYWDTVKVTLLSRALGPSGVAAPFSLADLSSYRLSVSARADGDAVRVRPTLTDARGSAVPLYGLALRGKAQDKELKLAPDDDRSGQDWPRWLKEGIMDFVAVGMYTPSTPRFRAQCRVLRQIADRELGGSVERIFPLLGVGYIQQANPSHAAADAVIGRHLDAAARQGLRAAGFFAFYGIRTHIETVAAHSNAQRGR